MKLIATCPECDRVFDLGHEDDAEEWSYGHDCEVEPDGEPDRDEPVGAIDREASRYEQNIRGGL
jgi:hypothetical protein